MKSILKYFCFCTLLLLLAACEHPDITLANPNDLLRPGAEFTKNNFEFSLFNAAIERAGLREELSGKGPFTVFAPGNDAFHEIGIRTKADLEKVSADSLKFLVRMHVLPRLLYKENVPLGSLENPHVNLAGEILWLARVNDYAGTFVNGAIIEAGKGDLRLSNGVFHEINKVLKYRNGTVQNWLEQQGNYSMLIAGLKKFGLWEQLANEGQWTVMAPDDAAFEKNGITKSDIEAMDPSRYGKRLFAAYLFPVKFFTTDVLFFPSAGSGRDYQVGTASIRKTIDGDSAFSYGINNQNFQGADEFFVIPTLPADLLNPVRSIHFNNYPAKTDHLNRNGVVHQIDDLIFLPQETLK